MLTDANDRFAYEFHRDGRVFGRWFGDIMAQSGITQKEMARRANTTQPTLSAIIHGRRRLGKKLAHSIGVALGLENDSALGDFIATAISADQDSPYRRLITAKVADQAKDKSNEIGDICLLKIEDVGICLDRVSAVAAVSDNATDDKGAMVIVMSDGKVFDCTFQVKERK